MLKFAIFHRYSTRPECLVRTPTGFTTWKLTDVSVLKVNVSKCAGYELDINIKSACLFHATFRYGAYCRLLEK
jgi:hypothetical protein